jgi:hypothetical protein
MEPPDYGEIASRVDRAGRTLAELYPDGTVPPEAYSRVAEECGLPLAAVVPEEIEQHPVARAMYVAGFCRDAVIVLQCGYDAVYAMFSIPQPTLH